MIPIKTINLPLHSLCETDIWKALQTLTLGGNVSQGYLRTSSEANIWVQN